MVGKLGDNERNFERGAQQACKTPPAFGHLPLAGEEPRGIQKKMGKRNSGDVEGGGKRRARHGEMHLTPSPSRREREAKCAFKKL
jgi:hypothetical protein